MIKHVYLIKLKDRRLAQECMEQIRSLKGQIPQLYRVEVGRDFAGTGASYDIIEVCEFLTMEDFTAFSRHPYHDKVRAYIAGVKESAIKVDYIAD